jgi:archaellin
MTVINGDVKNVGQSASRQPIIFTVSEPRLGANGTSTIESTRFTVKPVSGAFSVDLDPGPVTVLFGGKEYEVTVPADGPIDFWDLIVNAVAVPSPTFNLDAWLDSKLIEDPPGSGLFLI